MVNRQSVPMNVQRALWAESIGHCMNPECNISLIGETSIADQAHIVPHADNGDVSADNLILLCANCHREVDGTRTDQTPALLRQWKKNRNHEIRQRFTKKHQTFDELRSAVAPLLARNGEIFDDYGPNAQSAEIHNLWVEFEPEIIANNAQIELMLRANLSLLHPSNQDIVNKFTRHHREFVKTREGYNGIRVNLFPDRLCSIFGVGQAQVKKLVSNVSALQNFISHLVENGTFQAIQLEPEPVLSFVGETGTEELHLDDEPRIYQIYWNGRFYQPQTTTLRLESLVFFHSWLARTGIPYEIDDPRNLAKLTLTQRSKLLLNHQHDVILCYEYCLSVSTLQQLPVSEGLLVVNLYSWNGGCITQEARDYADGQAIKVFTLKEFYQFAHRNL